MSCKSPDDNRIFTRRSLIAVARAADLNLASSARVATDLSAPRSKAESSSASYASVPGIWITLVQVVSRGLAAGNHRLQKEMVRFFDERDQVRIPVTGHDKHALVRILRRIRVGQGIDQAASLNGYDHDLEGKPAFQLELFVLPGSQPKRLHGPVLAECVPFVPKNVPRGAMPLGGRWSDGFGVISVQTVPAFQPYAIATLDLLLAIVELHPRSDESRSAASDWQSEGDRPCSPCPEQAFLRSTRGVPHTLVAESRGQPHATDQTPRRGAMRSCSRSLAFLILKTWRSVPRGVYPTTTIRSSR